MLAELVAVGDELLYGDIINGNAAWLGRQLADVGIRVGVSVVVGDDVDRIEQALRAAAGRADAVIVTGGLGPTQDDLTREGIAAAAGVALRRDPFLESMLRRRFGELRRQVPEMNFRQADLPEGAQPVPNEIGTAPGIRIEIGRAAVYALPGVPHEMYPMFTTSVLPDLLRRAGQPAVVVHRVLRTAGIWESAVADALAGEVDRLRGVGNPTIAFLASGGQTRVRITARAADRAAAEQLIAPVEAAARLALGPAVYGSDDDTLAAVVGAELAARSATLAVAESLTGGQLAAAITETPGASTYFRGGVVSYATEAKEKVVGVPADVLATAGAVSPQTAAALAANVREMFGATWGLSTTGVAGPAEQEGKPVGTVHIGVAGPDGTATRSLRLPGNRPIIQAYSVVQALDALRRTLSGLPGAPVPK
ncbi:MAG: competence/damage-inducible protein A [Frankia sp.]|nr:competence/damage-inducible protein A [Frankia sp.]